MSAEPEITMKNTKSEMLEALSSALARAEAAEKGKLNPVKAEKEILEKKAVESAKAAVESSIFSVELNNQFKNLQTAIASEESRLQELYGVSSELLKLAVVIETGRERQAHIDSENSVKIEEAKTYLESLRKEYAQKRAELQEEYDVMANKLKVERAREVEEYQYNLRRDREKENNAWNDDKAERERLLSGKESQAQALLAEAEAKAEYIKALEVKAEGVPALIESERKAAVSSAVAELN